MNKELKFILSKIVENQGCNVSFKQYKQRPKIISLEFELKKQNYDQTDSLLLAVLQKELNLDMKINPTNKEVFDLTLMRFTKGKIFNDTENKTISKGDSIFLW